MLGPSLAKLTAGFILASTILPGIGCPPPVAVSGTAAIKETPAPLIETLSINEITEKFGEVATKPPNYNEKDWSISGLTTSKWAYSVNLEFVHGYEQKTSTYCFRVKSYAFKIFYTPEIYLASEYAKLGCQRANIMAHEKRHVKTSLRTFSDFLPDFQKTITANAERMGLKGPYSYEGAIQGMGQAEQDARDSLKPLVEEVSAEMAKRQAAIDSDLKAYAALCPGQIPTRGQ